MKYQFQFAGATVNRRSSPPRKRLRIALLVVAFIMAVLAYWQYLQHMTRGARRLESNVEPAAATVAATSAASASATAGKTAVTAASPKVVTAATKVATKESAQSIATAASTETVPAAKNSTPTIAASASEAAPAPSSSPATPPVAAEATASPVAPATVAPANPVADARPVATVTAISTESGAVATTTPAAVPVMHISSEPPPPRKPRVRTPEDRLMQAGMTAFDTVLDLASKYPDSYGFRAQDAFKDATLGKPLPVYTIEESDRAKYKTGEPVKPLLKPTDTWVFPVQVGDHVCCMVQVHYTGRDYVPGETSKLLGTAWNTITQKWPASKGYHPCIVVNPGIPGYFFTVPELPTQNMTDIMQLTYYHPSLSPADVILASWR
jgi:hypothetical protein